MRWNIKHSLESLEASTKDIVEVLYAQRGLHSKDEIHQFLHPTHPAKILPQDIGINTKSLKKALKVLKIAKQFNTPVLIYGDYDADGITATAILWETLHSLGYAAFPFIPDRQTHGYGLSITGIDAALKNLEDRMGTTNKPLIITVDNGITAIEASEYIKDKKHQLIITDHHQPADTLPPADVILHSTVASGSAVAWFLAKELSKDAAEKSLDLLTIGTIADIMPLKGVNRCIVKHGLESLRSTTRPGLQAIFKLANIDATSPLSTYHVGYLIAPRINAMGRLGDATESLRLLVTRNTQNAKRLATLLNDTNIERQQQTSLAVDHALEDIDLTNHLLISVSRDYHEGIVGLIAGKLVEKHHRPAIAISTGEDIAKGSARSVKGISIIEIIREHQEHLLSAGGHPLAAGLSIESSNIQKFIEAITSFANQHIEESLLEPVIDIDCEIKLGDISWELYTAIEKLAPFGPANPRPVFAIKSVGLENTKFVGKDANHLKTTVTDKNGHKIDAIGFNLVEEFENIDATSVDVAFTIDKNSWNGKNTLQLKIKYIN